MIWAECGYREHPSHPVRRVSGLSWTIPNGMVAPGYVCPCPPVPMKGSTYWVSFCCAETVSENRTRNNHRLQNRGRRRRQEQENQEQEQQAGRAVVLLTLHPSSLTAPASCSCLLPAVPAPALRRVGRPILLFL